VGLDYSKFGKALKPNTEHVWLVLGVSLSSEGPQFEFIDSKTTNDQSELLQCVLVDTDLAKHYAYVMVVRQEVAHQKGWLKRYQTKY
jgi:hypothetical protein